MSFAVLALLLVPLAVFWGLVEYGTFFMLSGGDRRPMTVLPEHFGLGYEQVRFPTPDGLTLAGWFIPAGQPTDRTIILCHGWGTNKGEILPATHFLAERFNLLYLDFRVCGESEGKMSSLGYLEARDFDAALEFLKTRKPALAARLGAYGLSMGAAVAFVGAARRPEIRAAVIENPFRSYTDVLENYARHKYRLPRFPLISAIQWRADLKLDDDPEGWSPIRHAASLQETPILFVQAEDDPISPVSGSRALYELVKGPKELWVVPHARHEDVHEVAKEEYQRRIGGFFEKHL